MAADRTRDPVAACVDRVGAICRDFRIDSLGPQLGACRELLRDGGVVDVAVLGQFKAGKSSFLNGLIGSAVVPTDVLPATAVVTRIGCGPREKAVVRRFSGEELEIPLSQLSEFVTERGNPANAKQVAVVDVELPALAPYDGIRFVDTPGLGSVFAHNTKASKDWMPRVGAALVAVSVSHPLSEDDLLLLEDVSAQTPEAAILLTKADLVSGDELDRVVGFTRELARERTGKEWRILPVSDRPGFDTMRAEVRDHLLRRIAGRREEAFAEIARHKTLALVNGCRGYLLLAERAVESEEAARSDLRSALSRERRDSGSVAGEIRAICRHLKAEARTAADVRFHAYRDEVSERIAGAFRAAAADWRGNLAGVTRGFESWLRKVLTEEMGAVSLHGEGHLAGFLFRARGSVDRSVRAFQDRLSKEIERALGIRFDGARFDARVEEPSHPDVRLSPPFDTHFELLSFLVPMAVFRPLVLRHFRRRIPWEAEKNLSRVAAQWADAVGEVIDGLARDAESFLERELATIEGLVGDPGDAASRAAELRAALAELESLESALS